MKNFAAILYRHFLKNRNNVLFRYRSDSFTYGEVLEKVLNITFLINEVCQKEKLVGIYANRGFDAYTAIYATIFAGKGWVPLSKSFPKQRLHNILKQAKLKILIIDEGSIADFLNVFSDFSCNLTIILMSEDTISNQSYNKHFTVFNLKLVKNSNFIKCPENKIAYLIFTSGSTGLPKGVPVSKMNLYSYLSNICRYLDASSYDRFSQTFDLSFDLSIHDIFVPLFFGASLVPFVDADLINAARVINEHKITHWFSVPSQIAMMKRARTLKKNSLPSLKQSLFCGEPLPNDFLEEWKLAAPSSGLINLYGPTEATIACSAYKTQNVTNLKRGIVPIGKPFPSTRFKIVDENNQLVEGEGFGELHIFGEQVTAGYWALPLETDASFVTTKVGNRLEKWYKTGDLVENDSNGDFHFVGRLDQQIKLDGYRIELLEIENALRKFSDTPFLAVIKWPETGDGVRFLIAVTFNSGLDQNDLKLKLSEIVPKYMVPRKFINLNQVPPLKESGKLDKRKIYSLLEEINKSYGGF